MSPLVSDNSGFDSKSDRYYNKTELNWRSAVWLSRSLQKKK